MPTMTINLDGDNAWPELRGKPVIHLANDAVIKIVALAAGMASGKPSVCIRLDLPDGSVVLAETSARLFVMAAAAIVGKWPDADDGAFVAHMAQGKSTVNMFDPATIETAIGGAYNMPDGRSFWVDRPSAREMVRRIMYALKQGPKP